jgi:hypothetical protein
LDFVLLEVYLGVAESAPEMKQALADEVETLLREQPPWAAQRLEAKSDPTVTPVPDDDELWLRAKIRVCETRGRSKTANVAMYGLFEVLIHGWKGRLTVKRGHIHLTPQTSTPF